MKKGFLARAAICAAICLGALLPAALHAQDGAALESADLDGAAPDGAAAAEARERARSAAADADALRRDIIRFGTETEIAALMAELREDGTDALDGEIIALVDGTRNHRILTVAFNFFGERERRGLERRAIHAVEERFDEHSETVLAAIDYLGRIGEAEALPALRETAETEERRYLHNAIRAMGRIGGAMGGEGADDMAEYLIEFFEERDLDAPSRREIVMALGSAGSGAAVDFLAEIAADGDGGQFLRIAALESLAQIGDPRGAQAVLAGVSAGEPHVRAAAVQALGPFSGSAVDAAILDAFRDSFERARVAAAHASRERRLEAAVPYLRFRAARDDSLNVREQSIRALGAIGTAEAMGAVEELFAERMNSWRVRLAAAEMLMNRDPDRHLGAFVEEMDEARRRNFTALHNGFLRILGGTTAGNLEPIARSLMAERGVVERSYALEIAANNNLVALGDEIRGLAGDSNQGLARRARRTLERLGLPQ